MNPQESSSYPSTELDNVKTQRLVRQLAKMNGRLTGLYESTNINTFPDIDLLPTTFKELGVASEELQVAIEELQLQNQELLYLQNQLQQERDRYQGLFDLAPDSYLITDRDGMIREVNQAAPPYSMWLNGFWLANPSLLLFQQNIGLVFGKNSSKCSKLGDRRTGKLSSNPVTQPA